MKFIVAALIVCTPPLISAQVIEPGAKPEPPKLTPEQTTSILKQLDEIEGKFTKSRGDLMGLALTRCRNASKSEADALELYVACYKMEHFDKLNLKMSDFTEWRQRNSDKFKDPEFLYGNWLQVRFLTYAIQAQDARDDKSLGPIVAAVQTFVNDAVAAVASTKKHTAAGTVKDVEKKKGGKGGSNFGSAQFQNLLRESVKGSVYAKAFQLQDYLTREDWEYSPLAVQGVYDNIVFPYYLANRKTDLAAQWDTLIKHQLTLKQAVMTDSEYATYYKDHYPPMLWRRAKYLFTHDVNPILAMADMLRVIRENPTNPSTGDWIKELRDLVNQAQPGGSPPEKTGDPTAVGTAAK
jgi:hypothetical protein